MLYPRFGFCSAASETVLLVVGNRTKVLVCRLGMTSVFGQEVSTEDTAKVSVYGLLMEALPADYQRRVKSLLNQTGGRCLVCENESDVCVSTANTCFSVNSVQGEERSAKHTDWRGGRRLYPAT